VASPIDACRTGPPGDVIVVIASGWRSNTIRGSAHRTVRWSARGPWPRPRSGPWHAVGPPNQGNGAPREAQL